MTRRPADDRSGDGVDVEVTEVVPGEFDVGLGGRRCRVLIPAGVGVPGLTDDEVAGAVVRILVDQGRQLPHAVDLAALLREDPGLVVAIEERVEDG